MLAVLPVLRGQLSEKPESWLRLEGHFVADFEPSDAFYLRALCLERVRELGEAWRGTPAIGELDQAAGRALEQNNHNAAARYYGRLLLALRGETPGEWLEVASSLRFHLDRRVAAPGSIVHARLAPALLLDGDLKQVYTARVSVAPAGGGAARELEPVRVERLEAYDLRVPTTGLAEGNYVVRYSLADQSGRVLAEAARPLLLNAAIPKRVAALEARAEKLAVAGVAQKGPRQAMALDTMMFVAELWRRAMREPVGSYHQNLSALLLRLTKGWPAVDSTDPLRSADLDLAESLAGALETDKDPLAGRTGDLRLAYRSGVEKPFQPYRVYLPPTYDAARKWPLVVGLRSDTGDEGTLFDRCPAGRESELLRLARERGYVVMAPEGLGPYSYYVGTAADDVMRALERVRAAYSIDERQIFVTGHGMGGMAALTLTLDSRIRLAATAAVTALPIQANDFSRAADVPVLLLQAAPSRALSRREARMLGFRLARSVKRFEYAEVGGGGDTNGFAEALPGIFEFFDAVRAGTWKPSGKPVPLPEEMPRPAAR